MSKLVRIAATASAVLVISLAANPTDAVTPTAAGIRAAVGEFVTAELIHCTPGRKHSHGGMAYISDGCRYQLAPPLIVPNTRARWPFEGQPTVVRVPRRTCHVYGQSRVRPC
jgi:hypothetical protein